MRSSRTAAAGGRAMLASLAIGALALAACSHSSTAASGPAGAQAGGSDAAGYLATALADTARSEKGTSHDVDQTSRPAVKGKSIAIISPSQAVNSSQIPADAAVEAAKTIGWKATIYDAKLNPGNDTALIRQAISAGADAIILVVIDCQSVKPVLQEAKAKGVVIVPVYSFDCSDRYGGNTGESLFTAYPNYGAEIGAFFAGYGAAQANYIIADSKNKAKIIYIDDTAAALFGHIGEGFKTTIAKSGGAKIVSTLNISQNDILTGKLTTKIQAEVTRHPEADWIKSPFSFITQIGVVPALGANPRRVQVMGTEGFQPELDLVRLGKVRAVAVALADWVGWSAVDTINSVFRKEKPAEAGLGWTITDNVHNLPATGPFVPSIDFKAQYRKAWGVG